MKNVFKLTLFSLLLMQSCSEKPWLSGTIAFETEADWKPTVYLVQPEKFDDVVQSFVGKVLDSAQVSQNGHFEFKNLPEYKKPVLLELVVQKNGEKYPNRLVNENPQTDNYFPLIYQPGTQMVIESDVAYFQSTFSILEPSSENEALLRLRDLRLMAYEKYLEGQKDVRGADEDLLEREKNEYNFKKELIDFADSTKELLPAMVALRWASPEGDYERMAELVYNQSEKWNALHPEHPWVKELATVADKQNLPILVGDLIPEIQLPIRGGETASLQTLLKGQKLMVLDVWASWCAPCRVENRNVLVPLWEKYHADDFQIVAYGLESSEKAWNNAIQKDGAYRWSHASHLRGDQNPFMDALRLSTIPANFLLDGNGTVLAKNLHGEDLVGFVDEYMSK
ncbi:TlpA disulfide reductase family protein [Muricauda sp. 334s03]|uniref:TlpA disulfide reductase family protein n=1 Tax=Flagellimonas yonaguniensis TaxID=3031325 RepID=A0ABT5XYA4_9FLAO|nr:TlpA disulfide reductase family protein [[Muricauda] yonaguniensis]MDF0716125.1 TlpA disulfide reductase family protein [[Muricauda] yonaguniensis]